MTKKDRSPSNHEHEMKVAAFFWEGEHTMSDATFKRVTKIRDALNSEFCADRGLAMELLMTELSEEELQVLEKVIDRCRAIRDREAASGQTPEDKALEAFENATS